MSFIKQITKQSLVFIIHYLSFGFWTFYVIYNCHFGFKETVINTFLLFSDIFIDEILKGLKKSVIDDIQILIMWLTLARKENEALGDA